MKTFTGPQYIVFTPRADGAHGPDTMSKANKFGGFNPYDNN
ncbi:MAG TPA: hypothetical protein VFU77_06655 [Steroidobacteraceae bacterium]|nr:hypothetical protein [Steroidobacteraceae bacterium]